MTVCRAWPIKGKGNIVFMECRETLVPIQMLAVALYTCEHRYKAKVYALFSLVSMTQPKVTV